MSDGIINANANVDGGLLKASFGDSQPISVRELPDVTIGDAGKVLKVNPEGNWAALNEAELPAATSEDAGKVPMVDDNGAWELENIPKQSVIVPLNYQSNKYVPSITLAEFEELINSGATVIFSFGIRQYHISNIKSDTITIVNLYPYISENIKEMTVYWIDIDKKTWQGTSHDGYASLT